MKFSSLIHTIPKLKFTLMICVFGASAFGLITMPISIVGWLMMLPIVIPSVLLCTLYEELLFRRPLAYLAQQPRWY